MQENKYHEIVKKIQDKGYRLTNIRKAIIKILTEHDHININKIISILEKTNHNVNIMSIYNTIDLLSNEHIIHANVFSNNKTFELSDNIIHVICNKCHKIIFEEKGEAVLSFLNLQKLNSVLKNKKDFNFSHFDLEVHGICKDCQNKMKKN